MTKSELRQKSRQAHSDLSEEEVEERSVRIANQLLKLPIWDKIYYHVFLSITENKEVNTENILHLLAGKDKEIVVSKSDFATISMTHYLLTENTRLRKNEYHIPEPINGLQVPVSNIDVVFVPLLTFDPRGNRVGYGKGFYDRFLADCRKETLKIGLSFFEAVEVIDDVHANDIKLDYCVTPERIYHFE